VSVADLARDWTSETLGFELSKALPLRLRFNAIFKNYLVEKIAPTAFQIPEKKFDRLGGRGFLPLFPLVKMGP